MLSSLSSCACHQFVINPVITFPEFCHHQTCKIVITRLVVLQGAVITMTTKKGNPLLSVRIPSDLDALLEARRTETGGSRSDVAIEALEHYLRPVSVEDELPHLKRRLQQLETAMQQLTSASLSHNERNSETDIG
jgi:siroheme synthase (precorrin-2 oxidase/ferrochelatase)